MEMKKDDVVAKTIAMMKEAKSREEHPLARGLFEHLSTISSNQGQTEEEKKISKAVSATLATIKQQKDKPPVETDAVMIGNQTLMVE